MPRYAKASKKRPLVKLKADAKQELLLDLPQCQNIVKEQGWEIPSPKPTTVDADAEVTIPTRGETLTPPERLTGEVQGAGWNPE